MKKEIYILLTDTGTWFTKCIKLYTKKTFNHASLSLDKDFHQVYSFGRKNPYNPFFGGFVKENWRNPFFRHTTCAIYACTISNNQYNDIQAFLKELNECKHQYRYNLLGLFAILFNIELERSNAYFCSQFVAATLEKGKVNGFGKPVSLVTPFDLGRLPQLRKVYEGKLSSYINLVDERHKINRFNFA